ncbi:type IV secretion system protein [Salmonella enterica]|nr:type IV secretion system protein [Salmonella enterica]EKZ3297877.1 type IV secretion system protein [Salmonella enterica]
MGLKKYFRQSKQEARKTPGEKEQDKKLEKSVFNAAKEMARDRDAELKKSLRSTRVGFVLSAGANIVLAVAIACMAPLKSVEPFLLRVDNSTGYTDVVRPFNQTGDTFDEAVSRYFLTQFIENREGYEWYTIQNMLDTVELMSSSAVFNEYKNMIYGPLSPLNKLKKNNKIMVRVKAITFLDDHTAQGRFVKAITDPDGRPTPGYTPTQWIATIKFDFDKSKVKTEADRQINPFGLNVLSYRVDPEVVK